MYPILHVLAQKKACFYTQVVLKLQHSDILVESTEKQSQMNVEETSICFVFVCIGSKPVILRCNVFFFHYVLKILLTSQVISLKILVVFYQVRLVPIEKAPNSRKSERISSRAYECKIRTVTDRPVLKLKVKGFKPDSSWFTVGTL